MKEFYEECLRALDALPKPELGAHFLEYEGQFCILGAVMRTRGLDTLPDPEPEIDEVEYAACTLDIPYSLAWDITSENDRLVREETHAQRYLRMTTWLLQKMTQ